MMQASDKKILVVDDDPDIRNLLAACIKKAGFRVEIALDGLDALDKIQADIPDMITVDMVMPRRSCVNLIRKLRNNDKWVNIPIIVISPHASDDFENDEVKAFEGFTAQQQQSYIFKKPIAPALILKTISEILNVKVNICPDE